MIVSDIPPLLWSIPDLLCPGAPVIETGESGLRGARGTIVRKEEGLSGLRVWWETLAPSMVTSLTGGTALDVEHLFGCVAAAEWLRRAGARPEGCQNHPYLLAWSVHSVVRGGPAIRHVLRWREIPEHGRWREVWPDTARVECFSLVDERGKQVHVQRTAPTDIAAWATESTAVYDLNGGLYLPELPALPGASS